MQRKPMRRSKFSPTAQDTVVVLGLLLFLDDKDEKTRYFASIWEVKRSTLSTMQNR